MMLTDETFHSTCSVSLSCAFELSGLRAVVHWLFEIFVFIDITAVNSILYAQGAGTKLLFLITPSKIPLDGDD
jgi:hypothetical protein